ncbi:MAG: PrsW family intrarane metalloprotease [Pseudonocardiales bacterium]|nr:PrsW family intrarane metalloprotease [Pseudonocardiales bacterium]
MSGLRGRSLQIVSWVGLGVSTVTLLFALPRLFDHGGGAGRVLGNAAAVGWTLLLITLAIAPVRTFGPRAVAGAWFSGFFGVISLSTLVGRPVVKHFGSDSAFAVAFWVPFTEEVLKLAPVALLLVIATRNRQARPSVGDAVLFAATVGGGFAVYENALYARSVGGWTAHPPLSLLVPSLQTTSDGRGTTVLVGGHLVFTAVTGLGLALTLAYRRRFRGAWLAAPVSFAAVLIEHAMANELSLVSAGATRPLWLTVARVITLDGYLSTILLMGGLGLVAVVERRLVRTTGMVPHPPRDAAVRKYLRSLRPEQRVVAGRAVALAFVQCAPRRQEVRP